MLVTQLVLPTYQPLNAQSPDEPNGNHIFLPIVQGNAQQSDAASTNNASQVFLPMIASGGQDSIANTLSAPLVTNQNTFADSASSTPTIQTTATSTSTSTLTDTVTATVTPTPTVNATNAPEFTSTTVSTSTPVTMATPTITATATVSVSIQATVTPTNTPVLTGTVTATAPPTPTASVTSAPTNTASVTATPSATNPPEFTNTAVSTVSLKPTQTSTPTNTPSSTTTASLPASPQAALTSTSTAGPISTVLDTTTLDKLSTQTNSLTTTVASTKTLTPAVAPTTPITPTNVKNTLATAAALPVVDHCGIMVASETWVTAKVHRITCNVTVSIGSTLTVAAGAVVKFTQGTALSINGNLSVPAVSNNQAVFTSIKDDTYGGDTNGDGTATGPAAGDWGQIQLNVTGKGVFNYAVIRYGGIYGPYYAAILNQRGSLSISNSTVAYSYNNGIYSLNASPYISNTQFITNSTALYLKAVWGIMSPVVKNNTFTGNSMAIRLDGDYLTGDSTISGNHGARNGTNGIWLAGGIAGATTLAPNPGFSYVISSLSIPLGQTLALKAGVSVKFDQNGTLNVAGTLSTQGTASLPVVFTSLKDDSSGGDTNNDGVASSPARGDWANILVSGTGRASLVYAIAQYGGSTCCSPYAILQSNGGSLALANSTVIYSGQYGVYADGGALSISNSTLRNNNATGVYAHNVNAPALTANTFTANQGYAAYLYYDDVGFTPSVSGNAGSGNLTNGIGLSGAFNTATLAINPGLPFVIDALTVNPGTTLTIRAGVILKFNGTSLTVNGTLAVQGVSGNSAIFTSFKDDVYGGDTNGDGTATGPATGDWGGISVSAIGRATLTYATAQYGGGPCCSPYAILQSNGGSLTVANSTIAYSGYYGIYANAGALSITNSTIRNNKADGVYTHNISGPILTGNSFTANQGYAAYLTYDNAGFAPTASSNTGSGNNINGIGLGGTLNTSTLATNPGLPYVLDALTVNANNTLTIRAGVILKFNPGVSLNINGTLTVQGISGSPAVFTSLKDDAYGGDTNNDGTASHPAPGDWGGILLSNAGRATLTYATAQYGGVPCCSPYGLLHSNGGSLSVANSTIAYSYQYGVYADGGTLSITNSTVAFNASGIYANGGTFSIANSTIRNNADVGIYRVSGAATISNNAIYGNQNYGVYFGSSSGILKAENNWWGADSGPAPYGAGNAINYDACYDSVRNVYYVCKFYVDADPWSGKGAFSQGQLGNSGPAASHQPRAADPVNTANGNYAYSYTDLSITTRGLPLDFTRSYNSLTPQNGPLGWGWTHSWNIYLTQYNDNSVVVTFGDGHGEKWIANGTAYVGAPGIHGALVRNGDGTFVLTQKDQSQYTFAANGRLTYVQDKNANRTTLTYDAQGRLTQITEPAGRSLTLSYSSPVSVTLISQVADNSGRSLGFTYNTLGELVRVTDVMAHNTTMAYAGSHRLATQTDANGHVFINNTYDSAGRVIKQVDAKGNIWTLAYDEPSHKTFATDPLGRVTVYEYDGDARLIRETDALSQQMSYSYDADSNRTQVVDKRGNPTRMAYDVRGNTIIVTDTLGFVTKMTYDAVNNLLTTIDALGHSTTFVYDSRSNLTSKRDALNNLTQWTYSTYGQVLSEIDARNNTTRYTYNTNGYRQTLVNPLGQTTTFVYDAAGRLQSQTDALGRVTTYTYDAANRILTVSAPLGKVTRYAYDAIGNRTSITDPRNGVTTFTYDEKDRLSRTIDPLGNVTSVAYDSVGNQISVTDPLNHTTTYTYDALDRRTAVTNALGQQTTYAYDANGNRTSMTDAKNSTTTYLYNALNQLTQVTDARSGKVKYTYDAVGNRRTMVDANNHTTTYTYDNLNRLASESTALNQVTRYTYDAVGNRTRKTKPDSTNLDYTYDPLNRLAQTTYSGGMIRYAYDAVGNRTKMTDTVGVTVYTYDALDRVSGVTDVNGTLQYGYDLNNNRTSVTYPGGNTVTSAYDAANRLTSITDWANRTTVYTYDAANRQTKIQYPNGIQAVSTYDDADRLLSLVHKNAVNATIASATYVLDAVGNRTSMQDLTGTTSYLYDTLYRLTRVIYPGGEQVTYTYDAMGNRLTMNSTIAGLTSYTYDAADRLLTFTKAGSTTNVTWDANGNMTGKGSGVYAFDPLDRLTKVISGTTTVAFAYDGDGVRLRKTVNGTVTNYLQDVAAPLPVVVSETIGTQSNRYIYGSDLIAQVNPTGVPSFYHTDGLGSTRALSDQMGQRTDAYSYDVFGATRSHTGSAGQPFTYTGEQVDGELGLVFLRARYYDPMVGRFISRDPISGIPSMAQTLNHYIYAANNPVYYVDHSGKFVVALIALGLIGWGMYEGLSHYATTAQQWGNAYGDVLNTAGNPDQKEGDYDRAVEHFTDTTKNLQRETWKVALTTPGTSLTGPISTDLPSTWSDLISGYAKDKLLDAVKDKLYGWWLGDLWNDPSNQNQIHSSRSLWQSIYSGSSPANRYSGGGGGGGSWGGPPGSVK
ncbi:MAG: right-handed parallel beta-helix repeat-containing protein [Caldilineaceae bacterium]